MPESVVVPQLEAVEEQFDAVATAVREGDAARLRSLSARLQHMIMDFANAQRAVSAMERPRSTELKRIQALGHGFLVLRESLLRRQALIEQALQVVVPTTQSQTYTAPKAANYGAGPKASGRLQSFTA